ncbi:MAG TPA: DoxX family protein [Pseudonocardiaceae bacterium]|jgi:putative oxidoreductase|nr:DoxX family protein [Pseudonocardiaceae bacterium]
MSETTINESAATISAHSKARTAQLAPIVLSMVRIVVSFLWICHGLQGFFGLFGGVDGHGGVYTPSSGASFWASVIEVVVGAIVLVGLATRPAAVLCSGVMAFAYFTVHARIGLFPIQNMGEESALYSWVFLLIAVLGPGRFAIDTLIRRRKASRVNS